MSGTTDKPYIIRTNQELYAEDAAPSGKKLEELGRSVEPWLTALMQAEYLNLLLGSGFTAAIAAAADVPAKGMETAVLDGTYADKLNAAAERLAKAAGRGKPNFEDQLRAIGQLIEGLEILSDGVAEDDEPAKSLKALRTHVGELLNGFCGEILASERGIRSALESEGPKASEARRLAAAFVLAFTSRAPTRDRPHIFTTNYDRLVEHLADLLGLRIVDRFVGMLEPIFRSSRLGIDIHYDPPGIRGEPRYLEGIVRLTKLHGSLDWRYGLAGTGRNEVLRVALPFGAPAEHPEASDQAGRQVLIYPNPAKDWETSDYPYADLFRDFAAAICRPNAVLFTFGYGFGDDHVNRHIRDMLTLSSTHLVIMARSDTGERISRFLSETGREEQVTLLMGKEIVHLPNLVRYYLPKPAIDRHTIRMVELINRRSVTTHSDAKDEAPVAEGHGEEGAI